MECPIAAVTPDAYDGGFIDSSPNMLNVTVTRAKDSCLVFGDVDVLAAAHADVRRSGR